MAEFEFVAERLMTNYPAMGILAVRRFCLLVTHEPAHLAAIWHCVYSMDSLHTIRINKLLLLIPMHGGICTSFF